MVNNKKLFINGPINYIKLKLDNKVIWIFMDYHEDLQYQQKCEDYEAKDLDKFLFKELNESKEPIDFFLEINPTDINYEYKYHRNDNYILETRKIFRKLYKDKVDNKNIRLHYIDIRDYTYGDEMYTIGDNLIDNYNIYNLKATINLLERINMILTVQLKFIDNVKNNKNVNYEKIDLINLKSKNNLDKEYTENILKDNGFLQLLDKIFFKYNYDNTKKIINNYFQENFINIANKIIDYIHNFIKEINEIETIISNNGIDRKLNIYYKKLGNINSKTFVYGNSIHTVNEYSHKIYDELFNIYRILSKLNCIFMDCFFIRRLIEKKYINKSIVYTGASHSTVYVWMLVKYFNYTIDEYNYIDEKYTVKEFEKFIKKSKSYEDLYDYILPKKFTQCINLNF